MPALGLKPKMAESSYPRPSDPVILRVEILIPTVHRLKLFWIALTPFWVDDLVGAWIQSNVHAEQRPISGE